VIGKLVRGVEPHADGPSDHRNPGHLDYQRRRDRPLLAVVLVHRIEAAPIVIVVESRRPRIDARPLYRRFRPVIIRPAPRTECS
jgi:hypothetical protein